MKFRNLTYILSVFTLSVVCFSAQAFYVSSMFVTADDKGNGIITLTNDESRVLFIEATVSEIEITGNGEEILDTKYDRSNIDQWKISVTHPKIVLKPGESKDIGIRSLCHNTTCDDSEDLMFFVTFSPSTFRTDESDASSAVEINYGFSPVFIIPTSKPVFDYDIQYKGDALQVYNKSNTKLTMQIDVCTPERKVNCKRNITLVAGRNKSFPLSEVMRKENKLKVTAYSHDRKYKREHTVIRSR